MDQVWYIYKHTNKINNKVYIGQTCTKPEYRWGKNGSRYQNCPKFWNAIQKYGWDNFSHEILESVSSKEEADSKEKYWIQYYDSLNDERGYNILIGGNSSFLEHHHTEESKKKISLGNKGKIVSEESKEKMRQNHADFSGINNPMFGKHHSEETRKKLSAINKGKVLSEETKCKISESTRGEKNHNYGKHLSEDTKEKLRQSALNRDEDYWIKNAASNFKAILICLETGQQFSSPYEAELIGGFSRIAIRNFLKGKQKTVNGFHFQKIPK